jgi:[ribosomal protein S5]-alanine N-acetyltransferase
MTVRGGEELRSETVQQDTMRPTVTLRRLTLRDHSAWREGFATRSSPTYKYDQGPPPSDRLTLKAYRQRLQRYRARAKADELYVYGVFDRLNGRHVGTVDLHTISRSDLQWANLGYVIHNQYQGKGYGTSAIRAALHIGFGELKYHRIEAAINLDNHASKAAAMSAGMKRECIRRSFIFEHGEWVDHVIFAAIAP